MFVQKKSSVLYRDSHQNRKTPRENRVFAQSLFLAAGAFEYGKTYTQTTSREIRFEGPFFYDEMSSARPVQNPSGFLGRRAFRVRTSLLVPFSARTPTSENEEKGTLGGPPEALFETLW